MQSLDAAQTRQLLPYSELAEALLEVLNDKRSGSAVAPGRMRVPLPNGAVLLLMPASDATIGITKLVTVHRDNPQVGLPAVQAEVLVFDARTGERLLSLDGATVTARRTAALSLLAARLLAARPDGPMLIVGAGVQGRSHAEAFIEGLGVQTVYVASRTREHAEQLAEHVNTLGAQGFAVSAPTDVLHEVTLIATCTTSPTPVLPDAVRPDDFVAAVGAYSPDMAELPAPLVRRSTIYVDTFDGCRAEAGDLIMAEVDWSEVRRLEDAPSTPPPPSGPVLFKSVGLALWDLAAARLAVRQLGLLSE